MSDYGLKVSKDGVDVRTATGVELLLNLSKPQAKLDTTKTVSFQNIDLLFLNDPPEGTGAGDTATTLVYKVAHGYTYTPSFWCLVQETPPSGTAFYQAYFQDTGLVAQHTGFDYASFYVKADATNVNFYVDKYYDSGFGGLANNISGMLLRIRLYIFVEDLIGD